MRIFSIFSSIEGEVSLFYQGGLTVFIRCAGCNLRCKYCDTKYALPMDSGEEMSVDEIVTKVGEFGISRVTITGGEPLLQKELFELTRALWGRGYKISVETNGSMDLIGHGVSGWVVDYKLPSSGEMSEMITEVFLRPIDFVKFVILDRDDYEVALVVRRSLIEKGCTAKFAFSPVYGLMDPAQLVSWLVEDRVDGAILNVQLHKLINLKESK